MPSVANNQYKMLTIVNWLLVLSTLVTFTTAFAATVPGACAVAAQSFGKGRVVVSADPMAFQPYRILEADNASILLNTLGWLLASR